MTAYVLIIVLTMIRNGYNDRNLHLQFSSSSLVILKTGLSGKNVFINCKMCLLIYDNYNYLILI